MKASPGPSRVAPSCASSASKNCKPLKNSPFLNPPRLRWAVFLFFIGARTLFRFNMRRFERTRILERWENAHVQADSSPRSGARNLFRFSMRRFEIARLLARLENAYVQADSSPRPGARNSRFKFETV